jgi:hypothetical protein
VKKPERKRPPGRPRLRLRREDNIKLDLKSAGRSGLIRLWIEESIELL